VGQSHTKVEVAVLVADALAQVEVTLLAVAVLVHEGSTENRNVAVSLERKMDVLG